MSIHPGEKVRDKLKEREELRKLARESNLISGSVNEVQGLMATRQQWMMDKMLQNIEKGLGTKKGMLGPEKAEDQARDKLMNQYMILERLKQLETGNSKIITKDEPNSQTQKLLQKLESNIDLRKVMFGQDLTTGSRAG